MIPAARILTAVRRPCAGARLPAMQQGTEQLESDLTRWIPIVVPLSALLIVVGVYLVAAEVLTRIV